MTPQMVSKHETFGKHDIIILSSDPIPIGYWCATSDNAMGFQQTNPRSPVGHVQRPATDLYDAHLPSLGSNLWTMGANENGGNQPPGAGTIHAS